MNEESKESRHGAKKNLELLIPENALEERVLTARAEDGVSENPFNVAKERILTQQSEDESQNNTPRREAEYDNLAEFTQDNLINYQPDGKTESAYDKDQIDGEPTADFENSEDNKSEEQDGPGVNQEESSDKPPEASNVNGSAFFSRDFRVLNNATYGNPDQADMILKQLHEEHGSIDQSMESR